MQLYIPEIGDVLVLQKDWTFDLYNEDRNKTLMEFLCDKRELAYSFQDAYTSTPQTIPSGARLKVDRIYIRKGNTDYSSLSFLWVGARTKARIEERTITSYMPAPAPDRLFSTFRSPFHPMPPSVQQDRIVQDKIPARPVRFWAKLADVNNIIFEKG